MVHHHLHVVLPFASSTADLHPVKDDKSGIEGLYWIVDYPWPLWDRDVSPCVPHTLQHTLGSDNEVLYSATATESIGMPHI